MNELPTDDEMLRGLHFRIAKTQKLKSCSRCTGLGYTEREEIVSYHNNDSETHYEKCEKCAGFGLLKIITKYVYVGNHANVQESKSITVPFDRSKEDPVMIAKNYDITDR